MKGFEIGINMMVLTVFAFIGIGLAFVAFIATTEYFPELQDWLLNLFNETLTPDMKDNYEITKVSMQALVCAINTVATGEEYTADGCSKFYTSTPPKTSDEPGSVFPNIPDSPVVPEYGADTPPQYDPGVGNMVSKDYSDFMTGLATRDTQKKQKTVFTCNQGYTECTLYNFRLPQEFGGVKGTAEEWVKGCGDPDFLMYWQEFPEGEDQSWNSFRTWAENVYDIIFAWWGAGKVFRIGKGTAKITFQYTVKKGIYSAKDVYARIVYRDPLEYFVKHTLNQKSSATLKQELGKIGEEILSKKLMGKEIATLAKRGIAITPWTVAAALIDSINAKYKQYTNSIVLKIPFNDPENKSLQLNGEPVFLKNKKTSFYMVSPCDANLKVERVVAECNAKETNSGKITSFAYDLTSGSMRCYEPDFEDYKEIPASEIECRKDKNIAEYFPGEDPTIPSIISGIEGKDELRISNLAESKDVLNIRDPIHGVTFILEKKRVTIEEPTEIGFIENEIDAWEITRITFENTDGSEKTFNVVDGKTTNPEFIDLGYSDPPELGKYIFNYIDPESGLIKIEIKPDNFNIEFDSSKSDISGITRERGKNLQCTCEYTGRFTDHKAVGLTADQIISECDDYVRSHYLGSYKGASDLMFYDCNEVGTPETPDGNVNVERCECAFKMGSSTEKYYVYGKDEADATEKCQDDFASFQNTKNKPSELTISNCQPIQGDFEDVENDCPQCGEYKKILENIKLIKFEERVEKIETDVGDKNLEYNSLIIVRDDYSVVFTDKDSKVRETIEEMEKREADGIAETIGIDKKAWYEIFWYSFPDQVLLEDMDFDGKIDIVSTKLDCKIPGVTVELVERNSLGDEPNFCFAPGSKIRTAIRWVPEAGILLGGVAGLLGGPLAGVSVPGGMVVGQRVGAAIFTAYVVVEKFTGSADIWPGKDT